MAARKLALAVGGALALAACAAGGPAAPDADAARDAALVVDPAELVALAGGPGTADRLARLAEERGYRVERRDPLPGLGLELLTLRLPADVDPVEAIARARGARAGGDRRAQPRLPRPGRRRCSGPSRGPTPTGCSAGPPPAARRGSRSG